MTFDLFTVRSILLPYAFVWEKCSEFQTTSPEPLGQFCSNFIWSLLRVGEQKIAKMVAVRWPRWPPRPYMVKTFKNLLLQNRECLEAEPLQESSGTGGLPTLLKELSYVDVWPFYGKVKFASLCICMGKTLKKSSSPKPSMPYGWIFAYVFGNRRATKIAKIMVMHWHLTFFTLLSILLPYAFVWGKMFRISNNFSSGASGPILLKFHMEPP